MRSARSDVTFLGPKLWISDCECCLSVRGYSDPRRRGLINGAHVVLYSKDPEADRAFFSDVLKFNSVDAGHGWLIFALPSAEAAFHDAEQNDRHELYFMCDDIIATLRDLEEDEMCRSPRLADSVGGVSRASRFLEPAGAAHTCGGWSDCRCDSSLGSTTR